MAASLFRLDRAQLQNYRCFENLDLRLERDLTVLFADNGGGKTLALRGVAALLGAWFTPIPGHLWSTTNKEEELRQVRTPGGAWEPAGVATLQADGEIAGKSISWKHQMKPDDQRNQVTGLQAIREASRMVMRPGKPWPLLLWYGTQRLWNSTRYVKGKSPSRRTRKQGYTDCLDPRSSEAQLDQWLYREAVADVQAYQQQRPPRGFEEAVRKALLQATTGLKELRYDIGRGEMRVTFPDGREVGWWQLSDGFHIFMGLVADIARRAIMLNDHLGPGAVEQVEGVVLIDEVDLHLHPRWQVEVLGGLRRAFPKLQFVVTTHSALVLSGAENRQIRELCGLRVLERPHHVQGRDANAIYREEFRADIQGGIGKTWLRELHKLVDEGQVAAARARIAELREIWGPFDAELSYLESLLGWGEE